MEMKTIIAMLIAFTLFASCKKDVKCDCKTTITSDGSPTKIYNTSYVVKETTEKAARKSHCSDYSTMQTVDKITTSTETTCEIKYK